ncbi:MAG: galactokinase [bacterium]
MEKGVFPEVFFTVNGYYVFYPFSPLLWLKPTFAIISHIMCDRAGRLSGIFRKVFGAGDIVAVRAPGRVNLIGEHTDYNDGFVLPCAISREVLIVGTERGDRKLKLNSINFDESAEVDLASPFQPDKPRWANYVEGVVRIIEEHTGVEVGGFSAAIEGDVPLGSGLSSSAALEVASGVFVQELFGLDIPAPALARLCQEAEHRFIGVKCGIMDQFASRLCEAGHALFLDCRSLEYEQIPLNLPEHEILILDTGVSRGLADSAYNERRDACTRGVSLLQEENPGVRALRDVSIEEFLETSENWDATLRAICEHIVRENDRVLRSIDCLRENDIKTFGKLLYASHESLRDLYRVSCAELDLIAGSSRGFDGVEGARMTGAGFGGCAIALVESGRSAEFEEGIKSIYREKTGKELKVYRTFPARGAGRIEL